MRPKICEQNVCLHKNSLPKPKEEMQPEVIKKIVLEYRHESNSYAIFGLFKVSCFCQKERNSKLQIWNFVLNWIECLNWRQRYAENEIEKHKQSYSKHWGGRKTKSLFLEKWIEKLILKENENGKDKPYFILLRGTSGMNWFWQNGQLCFYWLDWKALAEKLYFTTRVKLCCSKPWAKEQRRRFSRLLNSFERKEYYT